MTIGAIARSHAAAEGQENEDFICLRNERDRLQDELKDVSFIFSLGRRYRGGWEWKGNGEDKANGKIGVER